MDDRKQGGLLVCRLSARAKSGPSGCKWRQSGSRPKTGHCGGRGDAYLAARAPSGRLPAAVATRSGVEAQRGQEAGCITPGTAPHWPPAGGAAGPAPNWLGISSRRLIGYWPPLRSGLCHTHRAHVDLGAGTGLKGPRHHNPANGRRTSCTVNNGREGRGGKLPLFGENTWATVDI